MAVWLFSSICLANAPLVLISIDGFSQRYFEQYQPKTLNKLLKQGTSAKALLPVYPSKTFPNHLSIITGLYPVNHGIIHNSFYHRQLKQKYSYGAGKYNASWLTGKPLWYLNELHGNKSAIYFWPESEAAVNDRYASYYQAYEHFTPNKARFTQMLNWLRLPKHERPNFVVGYFSTIDDAGHNYGDNTPELAQAISRLDDLLADFVATIKHEFQGNVNLVIVSDHGMTKLNMQPKINWRDNIANGVMAVNGGTQLYLYSNNKQQLAKSLDLFAKHTSYQDRKYRIYKYPNYPKHWHLNKLTDSVPDAIVDAMPSYIFNDNIENVAPETHGYDPQLQSDLDAIFIGVGPAFAKNKKVESFSNIHVFPILSRVLGLPDKKDIDASYELAEQILNKL